MKWRLILYLIVSFSLNAKAQEDTITWQNKTPFPSIPRIDYASFVIDSDYYIVGGVDGGLNTYSEVWKYDIPNNTWQQMNTFPGGPVSEPIGFAIDEKGFICCGIDSVTGYNKDNEFWEYFPAVDTWQHKANYPGVPRETPIRFVYNQYAFVGMGWGVGANDLWRYSSATDSWDSVSSISTGIIIGASISVIDSFAYILGGNSATTQFNDVWRYNMNQDYWDSIGIMPGGLRVGALFWTFDSTILIGYGFIQDTVNSSVGDTMAQDIYSYNTKTGIWDTITCVNFPDSTADDGSGCFLLGKTAFFFGGFKTDFPNTSYYNNVWSFDASQFFPPDTPNGIKPIEPDVNFKVYPNPLPSNQEIIISTSLSGDISFSDDLGQVIDERKIERGINRFTLNQTQGVIFYKATLQDGSIMTGKVVVY